jgi:hypothetical protein
MSKRSLCSTANSEVLSVLQLACHGISTCSMLVVLVY